MAAATKNTLQGDQDSARAESKKAGFLVLKILLGFFLVVASVDGYFVYKALSTNTGVVVDNYYQIGLHYNEIIAQAQKEKLAKENGKSLPEFKVPADMQ